MALRSQWLGEQADPLRLGEAQLAVEEDLAALRTTQHPSVEHEPTRDTGRAVKHPAGRADHLREGLRRIVETRAPRLAETGVSLAQERRDDLRARAQARVERAVELALETSVDEETGGSEDRGHRNREREREAQPDRKPAHPPPSLRSR